jgi:hypothetical protein
MNLGWIKEWPKPALQCPRWLGIALFDHGSAVGETLNTLTLIQLAMLRPARSARARQLAASLLRREAEPLVGGLRGAMSLS